MAQANQHLTRRSLLSAIPAVAAASLPALASPASPDQKLIDLTHTWRALNCRYETTLDAWDEASDAAFIAMPEVLRWRAPEDSRISWHHNPIADFWTAVDIMQLCAGQGRSAEYQTPRGQEVVAAWEQHQAAEVAADAACGLADLEKASDDLAAEASSVADQVLAMRATTIEGLLAKIAVAAGNSCDEGLLAVAADAVRIKEARS